MCVQYNCALTFKTLIPKSNQHLNVPYNFKVLAHCQTCEQPLPSPPEGRGTVEQKEHGQKREKLPAMWKSKACVESQKGTSLFNAAGDFHTLSRLFCSTIPKQREGLLPLYYTLNKSGDNH